MSIKEAILAAPMRFTGFFIFLPAFSLANSSEGSDFKSVVGGLYNGLFSSLVDLLYLAIIVFFAWSIARFMMAEGDKKEQAKDTLLWGLIALFVVGSMWGIVRILNATFFTETDEGVQSELNVYI